MIVVPSDWNAARVPCVLVRLEGCLYLCRVATAPSTMHFFELSPDITAPPSAAGDQDVQLSDRRPVTLRRVRGGPTPRFRYRPCAPGEADTVLELLAPRVTYRATALTLSGPRGDSRAAAPPAAAHLLGRYVTVGCSFEAPGGARYTVADLSLERGYRGVALVGAECRARLNDSAATAVPDAASAPAPLGLAGPVGELVGVLDAAAAAGPGGVAAVVVAGPHDCGVSLAAKCALARCLARVHVEPWSAALVPARLRTNRPVVALLLNPLEALFPAAADDGAADPAELLLARVRADAAVLARRFAVVVLAVAHDEDARCSATVLDRLFARRVRVAPPSAETRAELLAAASGDPRGVERWRHVALGMVGATVAETLRAGRGASDPGRRAVPFREVRWEELGGLAHVKRRLQHALVAPRRDPSRFRRFGLAPPRGVLLYGPPGCAKTTLVKALCSEGCFSLIYLDSASLLSSFVGESERGLRDVFARAAAQSPCVVFFDEVEVLGAARAAGDAAGAAPGADGARLLATLLTEMDGFRAAADVCFIGATNVPQLLDAALLRPGRFDYLVHVPLPDADDRADILRTVLRGLAFDTAAVAAATAGFSGADLQALASAAALELVESRGEDVCGAPAHEVTHVLLSHARGFKKCDYDISAIEEFHRRVS